MIKNPKDIAKLTSCFWGSKKLRLKKQTPKRGDNSRFKKWKHESVIKKRKKIRHNNKSNESSNGSSDEYEAESKTDNYVGSYDSSDNECNEWEYSDRQKKNRRNKTTCEFSSAKRVKKGLKKIILKKNNASVLEYIKRN